LIIPIVRLLYWAMFGELIQPVNHLTVTATLLDQVMEEIDASTSAAITRHPHGSELSDKIAEYDCAVVGHGDSH